MINSEEMKKFYFGKRVFVTGNTGFKGTWITLMLQHMGACVAGYALPITDISFYHNTNTHVEMQVEADIADTKKVMYSIEAFKPDIVIHLASYSTLEGNMKIPHYILNTNILGVLNVLEAVRVVESVGAVIIVTSDKCYLNKDTDQLYREGDELGANDPYGTSKVCQELLTECYKKTFFDEENVNISIATARASNLIGVGDSNISRLMPYLLETFYSGKVPNIRNPYAIRSWQYVMDALWGYLLLAKKLYENTDNKKYNGAYNFGPGEDGIINVGEMARLVGSCFGNNQYKVSELMTSAGREAKILKLDSTKAEKLLGWEPKYSLEQAVNEIVSFMKSQKMGCKLEKLADDYVENYLKTYNL